MGQIEETLELTLDFTKLEKSAGRLPTRALRVRLIAIPA